MARSADYRPDIDGLRAFAVLPVVAFHLGFDPLAGGYVGVDVFFVISGYLIARLIFAEIGDGSFSIPKFYARRMRRLFPALFVMLAVTAAISWVALYPTYFLDFGKSLASAALSASNLYFWSTANYFNSPVETKPLLHTWSLAVEEQFYLVFPLLAASCLRRGAKTARIVFAALFAASLVAAAVQVFIHAQSAFYLPHFRAWEPLLGVLLALNMHPRLTRPWMRDTAALTGIALILGPVFIYDQNTPFPGLAALPPCLGAALLIVAGQNGRHILTPLLCWRPVVFVGLVSYSLYLWHWPLITLYEQYTGDTHKLSKLILGVVSFGVACLSWWFVERPFRKPGAPVWRALASGGGLIAATVAIAVAIIAANGVPTRFSPDVVRIAAYMTRPTTDALTAPCFLRASDDESFASFNRAHCLHFDRTRPNVLVFGDSHARHLVEGIHNRLPNANIMQATASECAPLLGRDPLGTQGCADLVAYIYTNVLTNPQLDAVIIAARWPHDDTERIAQSFAQLTAHRRQVLIVGPTVEYNAAVPQLVAMSIRTGDSEFADRNLNDQIAPADAHIRMLAEHAGLAYFSAYEAFCPQGECHQLSPRGIPYQWDYGHLTPEGSNFLAAQLVLALPPESGVGPPTLRR